MRTRRLLWPVLAAALLAQPAAASASKLIYQCHDDLCSIRPDGSGRERLTRDGHRMPYTDPSVSRDGRRLAFGHADARAPEISDARVRNRRSLDLHNHSVPMRPLMRPDGSRGHVGAWHGRQQLDRALHRAIHRAAPRSLPGV